MAGDLIIGNVAASAVATKTNLMRGLAKSWANWNMTGTAALRDSFNVGSLTDMGVGIGRINFTAAMANANYAGLATSGDYSTWINGPADLLAASLAVQSGFYNAGSYTARDLTLDSCAAFGDLA